MARQSARAFHFHSIVENPYLNIGNDAVVAVKYGIGYDFMQRFLWIFNGLKTIFAQALNAFHHFFGFRYRFID